MRDPLGHLREYLRILKSLLQTGKVDYDGEFYQAHETIREPLDIPVMASALQQRSFEMCGAESDGAISWICPGTYLRDMALPAMDRGAKEAGRRTPPLIAHARFASMRTLPRCEPRCSGIWDTPGCPSTSGFCQTRASLSQQWRMERRDG